MTVTEALPDMDVAGRLERLWEDLPEAGCDGLVVTSRTNIRYLTGFSGSSALLFVTARSEALLITDFRYQTQVATEVGDFARVIVEPSSLWSGLWQQLGTYAHVKVAGFESSHLLHRDFQRLLEAGARYQWRPTLELVETLRERLVAAGRPAVRGMQFGHILNQWILPLGLDAALDATAGTLTISESAVV